MSNPNSIGDIFNTSQSTTPQWTEAEVIEWLWNLPRSKRDGIVEEMHRMNREGQSHHQIYMTLHEARRIAEEYGLGKASPAKWVHTFYKMFAHWQQTKSEMNIGDAMENLANLDMDKFGK